MATIEVNESNFQDTISKDGIVLIDCWASWCGPCRAFGPVFEEASEKHTDAV
ncbi:thioredoxin family protein, partial [Corynebacterium pyruviciproducens]